MAFPGSALVPHFFLFHPQSLSFGPQQRCHAKRGAWFQNLVFWTVGPFEVSPGQESTALTCLNVEAHREHCKMPYHTPAQ